MCAVTCDEDSDLCVRGLRDLSKAVGLMRRLVNPPCSGCSGVGRSSFSNTEENSSLRTCRMKQNNNTIKNLHYTWSDKKMYAGKSES